MSLKTILITGASGEMGHGLISHLAAAGNVRILAIDLYPPEKDLEAKCYKVYTGDVKDYALLQSITATYDLDTIYHLAAVLSISIGLLNLFPVPLLDGGHLMFYTAEVLRGRPLSEKSQEYGFRVGLVLVLMLMVFAFYNDFHQVPWLKGLFGRS